MRVIKWFSAVFFAAIFSISLAFAATTYKDMYVLSTDVGFQNRVLMSLIQQCVNVMTESPTSVPFHRERSKYATAVLNSPPTFLPLFVNIVATNLIAAGDATVGGTVVLTAGNVAAQSALVTDIHIDNSIASQFNSLFPTPGN